MKVKMLTFLWLHDKLYKDTIKALLASLICLAGIVWNFDYSKIYLLIKLEPKSLSWVITIVVSLIFVLFLIAFVFTYLFFNKKYKNYENLSKEEQKKYDSYFGTPSVYEKRGVLHL